MLQAAAGAVASITLQRATTMANRAADHATSKSATKHATKADTSDSSMAKDAAAKNPSVAPGKATVADATEPKPDGGELSPAAKAQDPSSTGVDLSHTVLKGALPAPVAKVDQPRKRHEPKILATFKPGDGTSFEPGDEDALQRHGLTGEMIARGRRTGTLAGAWDANLDDPNFGVIAADLPDVGERQLVDGSIVGSAGVRRTAADRAAEIEREEATGTDADSLARKAADKRAAQDRKAAAGKRR